MRESAFQELEILYRDLDEELDRLRPRCVLSGECCRFEKAGHELWTTTLEVQYLLAHRRIPIAEESGACPFLKSGRCSARKHRMLGCRIYFCDPGHRDRMPELYERYHALMKGLHRRFGIPYRYFRFMDIASVPAGT